MSTFAYTIREQTGSASSGTLDAPDTAAASRVLRERGAVILALTPVKTKAKKPGAPGLPGAPGASLAPRRPPLTLTKPRSSAIEVALKQLAVMLRSGLTLLESLKATGEQSTSTAMRRVLDDVASDVRSGQTFTAALKNRGCFSRIVTQLSEVGEQTGQIDLVLQRAAEALERRRLLKSQIISALLYPGVVFLAAVGVTIFILVYAIPKITVYLRALGRPLPPMTQVLVDFSDFLVTRWPMLIGGMLLVGLLFIVTYSVPVGRLIIDSVMLRIPLIGYIFRTGATSAFSRSMAILMSSGVTLIEALRTCQELHRNRRLAVTIARARESVMAGDALEPSFKAAGAFMPMLASMIAAGEKSGQLDMTLVECAVFHEQRLASLIRMLSSVIEVVVVASVGGIVGYVYIAFMVALYGAAL